MKRFLPYTLAGLLAAGCLVLASGVLASPVVIVKSGDHAPYKTVTTAITEELSDEISVVTIVKDKRNLNQTVREIWAGNPEVLVALGARALELCTSEFQNVPVVFGLVADPAQYVSDPSMVSGITLIPSETQFLKAVKMILPDLEYAAVLYDHRDDVHHTDHFRRVESRVGVQVHQVDLEGVSDLNSTLKSLTGKYQCMIVAPDPPLLSRQVFADLVIESYEINLPIAAYSSVFAEMGALMSVEGNNDSVGQHIAKMVRYLLEGGSNRDLGVRPPLHITITVNMAVAEAFGIEVPPGMMRSIKVVGD
jgi:ABC-type uncharacterized transport system substrate-binding protein